MSKPIEDYALIGDGCTAALVARDGAIDWLCLPRFDSDACFAALLGDHRHGFWRIAPEAAADTTRAYDGDTLVLLTEFTTGSGRTRLIDFMPLREHGACTLMRIAEGIEGEVPMLLELRWRFDYGNLPPWLRETNGAYVGVVGPDRVVIRGDVPVEREGATLRTRFTLHTGERVRFCAQHAPSHEDLPSPLDIDEALARTKKWWLSWIAQFDRPTDWPQAVKRSLLTLKALTHHPTGGIVAAPTLGLPEKPRGKMNWDYRYCWLRDSTFTLCALLNAGFKGEAKAWLHWLLRAVAGEPDRMRIMYRVDGGRHLEEWGASWLPGYDGARPVRIGNAAAGQRQLDVFGEVIDSVHLAAQAGLERSNWGFEVEQRLIVHVEKIWREPDQGMWESRGKPKHYVYSKVMAWVAVDRFLRLRGIREACGAKRVAQLEHLRQTMHDEICRQGFSTRRNSFGKSYGSTTLDASLLLLPLVKFLPVDDPRMAGTIDAIEKHLSEGGLVRRQEAPWFGPEEGAFIACSCWLADCMILQDRRKEARAVFERVLTIANDVGLLSEEYHAPSSRLVGNFPQALSHLAVVNTALSLCGPVMQRGGG